MTEISFADNAFLVTDTVEDLEIDRVISDLFIVDSHRILSDPLKSLDFAIAEETRVLCFGVFAERHHWFYQSARGSGAHLCRFDADSIVDQFPDQRQMVNCDPRLFQLIDTEPAPVEAFIPFAERRIHVRTMKGREFLTPRQQAVAEAQLGPAWFTGKAGVPIVPLSVSELQKQYLASKEEGREQGYNKFLLLKYRRGGFTTIEQSASYAGCVQRPMSHYVTLAHTKEATQKIFRMVSLMHDRDPERPRRVNDSKSSLELENGSFFFIGTAGSKGFSRGDTIQKVHGSEVAYWCQGPNQIASQEILLAGLTEAASGGEIVLETTANGNELFAERYREARRGQNDWWPIFLRWFDDPTNRAPEGTYDPDELRETIRDDERELVERWGLSAAQIAFRRLKKAELKRLFPQEYPEDDEECFLTSGLCYFDQHALGQVHKILPDAKSLPSYREMKGGYYVEWEAPIKGEKYVIGADTSEGIVGCDPNGLGVMRKSDAKQVAAYHGHFSIRQQANNIAQAHERYNRALIGVERNNHGHAVIDRLVEGGLGNPHYRGGPLYYFSDGSSANEATEKGRPGWDTNVVTRDRMLDDLAEVLESLSWVRDKDFVSEAMTFTQKPNGKFEGSPHDDAVMKWAIANQMRRIRSRRPSIDFFEGSL